MKKKMKTSRALAKRIWVTKSGIYKRGHSHTSHLAHSKTTKRKNHLRKSSVLSKSDFLHFKKFLPKNS